MIGFIVSLVLVSAAAVSVGWSSFEYDPSCSIHQPESALYFQPKRADQAEYCLNEQNEEEFWKPRPSDLKSAIEDDEEELDEDDDDFLDDDDDGETFNENGFDFDEDWEEEYEGDGDDVDPAFATMKPQTNRQRAIDRGEDLGCPQHYDDPKIASLIQTAREYIQKEVMVKDFYEPVRNLCVNKDKSCAFWASIRECEQNPTYMNQSCAPMCQTCELLHVKTRCVVNPNATDALYPGDLNKMFERIVEDPVNKQWKPVVLSRPSFAAGDDPSTADYQLGMWLIQFDSFATPEECDHLVKVGGSIGYNRSADVGEELEDGTFGDDINSGRTSTNAVSAKLCLLESQGSISTYLCTPKWCNEACSNDTKVNAVILRMENITGIPETNAEFLQLLRYEEGQYYQSHNDYIPYQVRIGTLQGCLTVNRSISPLNSDPKTWRGSNLNILPILE